MNTEPAILCFTHCRSSSVFCKILPEICPLCRKELSSIAILPFRIPFPFARANQKPCSIVIKPSNGTFLDCYTINNTDLHIGITTSTGIVFEYDTVGISKSKTSDWNECLVVYELNKTSWSARWDAVLLSTADKFSSPSIQYDENTLNCYTFVLSFVHFLDLDDLKTPTLSKETFCEKWVAPRLKDACRYIFLYREITLRGIFVQSNT